MIHIEPTYLETFLIWLTANDKTRSIDVPIDIGLAIEKADVGTNKLCNVTWLGVDRLRGIVKWNVAKEPTTSLEIVACIQDALSKGDMERVRELQERLKGL
jgi:hypothetical protein